MKLDDLFPSKYLKADDFTTPQTLHISGIQIEEVGQNKDRKPVLYFHETPKGIILNKTNFAIIGAIVGSDDTDHWGRHAVDLYKDMTMFAGKPTPCIRVRAPQPQRQQREEQYQASAGWQPQQARPQAGPPPGWSPPQPQPDQARAPWDAVSDDPIPDPGEPVRARR